MNTADDRQLDLLIVEDSPDDRFMVERTLRRSGLEFRLRWATCQGEFLEALGGARPDLVLLDFHLPDMSALDGLRTCGKVCPEVPVIVVTGGLADEEAAQVLRAGAQDYVLKDRLARLGPAVAAALDRARAQARRIQDAERLKSALVATIGAITRTVEMRDPYTAGHQERVADLSEAIGRAMGLAEDRVEGLRMGAQIHDIGKICVPSEILNRPGRLSAAEFALIKAHAEIGHEIVKGVDFPWPVARMVLEHHERLDGSGYPLGLKGGEILPEARVIAVADVVESMTSHRPYRAALGLDLALGEITSKRGTHFDAAVVDACLRVAKTRPELFAYTDVPRGA